MKKIILLLIIVYLNTQAQTWQVIGEMPNPVYGGEAVVVNSLIYILGGFSYSLNTQVNLIQEYNPFTGNWRIVDSLNFPRYGLTAGNYQDNIIVTGGVFSDVDSLMEFNNTIEMWNRVDRPFIYDNEPGILRRFSTGLVKDNRLFVFGGTDLDILEPLATYMYEYSIDSLSVTFSSNFNFSLGQIPSQQLSANAGDDIYLFGGILGNIAPSRSIFKYNINDQSLAELPLHLLVPRAGGKAIGMEENRISIIGGYSGQNTLSSVEIYEIRAEGDTIISGPALNFARSEFMAVYFENSIFVFGGQDANGQPVTQIEWIDFTMPTEAYEKTYTNNFELKNNYPNPFNPSTNFEFQIAERELVVLKVFDVIGNEIATLVNEEKPPGTYQTIFDSSKYNLSSGIYFYKLTAGNFVQTRKMTLLK
jgi:N-acetylneuraminic acid mutarotase